MRKIFIRFLLALTILTSPITLGGCSVFKQANQVTQVVTGNLTDAQTIRGAAIGILTTLSVIDTVVEQAIDSPIKPLDPYKAKAIVQQTGSLGAKVKVFIDSVNPLLEKEVDGTLTDVDKLEINKKATQYDILKAELEAIISTAKSSGLNLPVTTK